MRSARNVSLAGLLFSLPAWAQWTPELAMQVRGVGAVTPARDGRLAAWTQTQAFIDTGRSEYSTHIWIARADGSGRRQLTRGDASASSPSFSPDGSWIYFIRSRGVWRISVSGGEAERILDWSGTLASYRLSPDGKWIAFTGAERRADDELARRQKVDFRVIDENPANHSLWVVSTAERRARRRLPSAAGHTGEIAWSHDSRSIAYTHRPAAALDESRNADISEIDVESGNSRVIATGRAAQSDPSYSPDGRWIAYQESSDPPRSPGQNRIALYSRETHAARLLAATPDELPNLSGWAADSRRVYLTEGKGTRQVLYDLPLDGPPTVRHEMTVGTISSATLDALGTHAGLVRESAEQPPEAFLLRLAGGEAVQISSANAHLKAFPGQTIPVGWKAADGLMIEGLLTLPLTFEFGGAYPLVLAIHGGPFGAFQESFTGRVSTIPTASLAARGYAVLRPNPRGSTGYGVKFRFTQLNDRGGKDYEDLMAGVDHVVRLGIADPDRLAVIGYSYGGYMTAWTITHTRRFKAAVVGAGAVNLQSQSGTSDVPGSLPDQLGGPHWTNHETFFGRSPLSYVKNAVTPTLILHGEADQRVPVSQGYELYNALKRRGVDTQMVVYPRMQHGFNEPKFQQDLMQRQIDWIEKHLRGK